MTFLYPYIFLLLIPLALVLLGAWLKKQPSLTIPSVQPYVDAGLKRKWQPDWRKIIPFVFYSIAALLIITALARPQTGSEEVRIRAEGIEIMIVIDVSTSMFSYDVPEKYHNSSSHQLYQMISSGELQDRMTVAKAEIRKFIQERPDDRIGLIQFANGPDLVCAPTLDHGELLSILASVRPDPGLLGAQTGIAPSLEAAIETMERSKSKNGIIVLFTDGKDNVEAPITPEDAAEHAAELNYRVYTVGIGSERSIYPDSDFFGNFRLVPGGEGFDAELLKKIAIRGSGKYYSAADPDGMEAVMKEINQLEKTKLDEKVVVHVREWYPLCAALAGVAILIGTVFSCMLMPKLP